MQNERTTLYDFIKGNHDLLSALAILTALAGYFSTLKASWLTTGISFIFVTGMIMIFWELKSRTPEFQKSTFRLFIFNYVIFFGLWSLVLYWFIKYRDIWHLFLFVPLTIIFFLAGMSFCKFYFEHTFGSEPRLRNLFFMLDGKQKWWTKILYWIVVVAVGIFCFKFSILISGPLNEGFDNLFPKIF